MKQLVSLTWATVSLVMLILMRPAFANLYTLIPDTGLTDGYGFSGTVTTDGSIGTFTDASAITDWNITLLTPGGVDGVTSQVLTPATSTKFYSPVGSGDLVITASEISITNSGINQTTNLFFLDPAQFIAEEFVTFEGPIDGGLHGFASVSDASETPSLSSFFIGNGVSAAFAFIVPEPGALYLGLIGAGVLGYPIGRKQMRGNITDTSLYTDEMVGAISLPEADPPHFPTSNSAPASPAASIGSLPTWHATGLVEGISGGRC